jgi:hypothetical protein
MALPLFFLAIPGAMQHLMPFAMFLLQSIAFGFLFSWSCHKGGRSILSNLLIHNGLNFGISIVVIIPPVPDAHLPLSYLIVLAAMAACCCTACHRPPTTRKSLTTGKADENHP